MTTETKPNPTLNRVEQFAEWLVKETGSPFARASCSLHPMWCNDGYSHYLNQKYRELGVQCGATLEKGKTKHMLFLRLFEMQVCLMWASLGVPFSRLILWDDQLQRMNFGRTLDGFGFCIESYFLIADTERVTGECWLEADDKVRERIDTARLLIEKILRGKAKWASR